MTTISVKSSEGAGRVRRRKKGLLHKPGTPFWFLLPFFLMFIMFLILPVLYAIYQSLFSVKRAGLLGHATTVFDGLHNYGTAFRDGDFLGSILRMILLGVVQVPLMIIFALGLALILDSNVARFQKFFRTVYFAPYGVPGVIAALLWGFLYTPGLSPIVSLLGDMGLNVNFFGRGETLWSIANILIWTFTGYNMLVLFAQLQSIPHELYEAARMDGAGGWRIAWEVKIPLLRPALTLIAVFGIIGTLQIFSEPLILKPNDSNISNTFTPNLSAYTEAFVHNDYNYAAAQAVIIAVIALVLSFSFLKFRQRGENL